MNKIQKQFKLRMKKASAYASLRDPNYEDLSILDRDADVWLSRLNIPVKYERQDIQTRKNEKPNQHRVSRLEHELHHVFLSPGVFSFKDLALAPNFAFHFLDGQACRPARPSKLCGNNKKTRSPIKHEAAGPSLTKKAQNSASIRGVKTF